MCSKRESPFTKDLYASSFKRTTRKGARELKLLEARSSSIKPSRSLLRVPKDVTGAEKSIEDNLLAILDTSGVGDAEDVEDDKINFIEALHAVSITSIVPNVPTKKLFETILRGLQGSKTMEVTMASYQLLQDLNKVFPHSSITGSNSKEGLQLVIDHKVWTPLAPKMAESDEKGNEVLGSSAIGILALPSLLQSILNSFNEKQIDSSLEQSTKNLARTLMFRYLITLLWTDFDCRMKVFQACRDEVLLQKSFLNYHLQVPDKKTYTDFMKNLLRVIAEMQDAKHQPSTIERNAEQANIVEGSTIKYTDTACMKDFTYGNQLRDCAITYISMVISLSRTVTAAQMTPELADSNQRLDCIDTLMDILNYDTGMLEPLLKAIEAPSLKLYFALQYFVKLAPKPVVKQMQANQETLSLQEILKCCFDQKNMRNIYRCVHIDVLQTLLSHSFQAFLSMREGPNFSKVKLEVCNLLRDALSNLEKITNRHFELKASAKLALLVVEALSQSNNS